MTRFFVLERLKRLVLSKHIFKENRDGIRHNSGTGAAGRADAGARRLDDVAHVTQIVITRTESPTFQGASFGETGPYEKLVGRATGEIDPRDPRNAVITDIMLAPRNARGMVEYATDIYILRPVDPSRGNRKVLFELNNRGNMVSFGLLNDATTGGNDPTTSADAGIGFLMRLGYTIVQSGWDATVLAGGGRQTICSTTGRPLKTVS